MYKLKKIENLGRALLYTGSAVLIISGNDCNPKNKPINFNEENKEKGNKIFEKTNIITSNKEKQIILSLDKSKESKSSIKDNYEEISTQIDANERSIANEENNEEFFPCRSTWEDEPIIEKKLKKEQREEKEAVFCNRPLRKLSKNPNNSLLSESQNSINKAFIKEDSHDLEESNINMELTKAIQEAQKDQNAENLEFPKNSNKSYIKPQNSANLEIENISNNMEGEHTNLKEVIKEEEIKPKSIDEQLIDAVSDESKSWKISDIKKLLEEKSLQDETVIKVFQTVSSVNTASTGLKSEQLAVIILGNFGEVIKKDQKSIELALNNAVTYDTTNYRFFSETIISKIFKGSFIDYSNRKSKNFVGNFVDNALNKRHYDILINILGDKNLDNSNRDKIISSSIKVETRNKPSSAWLNYWSCWSHSLEHGDLVKKLLADAKISQNSKHIIDAWNVVTTIKTRYSGNNNKFEDYDIVDKSIALKLLENRFIWENENAVVSAFNSVIKFGDSAIVACERLITELLKNKFIKNNSTVINKYFKALLHLSKFNVELADKLIGNLKTIKNDNGNVIISGDQLAAYDLMKDNNKSLQNLSK